MGAKREIEDEPQATWCTLNLPDAETNPNLATLFQEIDKMIDFMVIAT